MICSLVLLGLLTSSPEITPPRTATGEIYVHSKVLVQRTRAGLPPRKGRVLPLQVGDVVAAPMGEAKLTFPSGDQWRMSKGCEVRISKDRPIELKKRVVSLGRQTAPQALMGGKTSGTAGFVGRGATFEYWSPIGNLLAAPTAFRWKVAGLQPTDRISVRLGGSKSISKEVSAQTGVFSLPKGQFNAGETYLYSLILNRTQNTPVEAGGWFRLLKPQEAKDLQGQKAKHFRQKGDAFDLWIRWARFCESQNLIAEAEIAYRRAAKLLKNPKALDQEIRTMHRTARGLEAVDQR